MTDPARPSEAARPSIEEQLSWWEGIPSAVQGEARDIMMLIGAQSYAGEKRLIALLRKLGADLPALRRAAQIEECDEILSAWINMPRLDFYPWLEERARRLRAEGA